MSNGGNEIDYEALLWLAKQPEPRFWLSDGMVNGGVLSGKYADLPELEGLDLQGSELNISRLLVREVNALMKRANILRIPDADTLMQMMQGRRVTLYRSVYMPLTSHTYWWSGQHDLPISPLRFQL